MPEKVSLTAARKRLRVEDRELSMPVDPEAHAQAKARWRELPADERGDPPRPEMETRAVPHVHVLRKNAPGQPVHDAGLWTVDDVEAAIRAHGCTEAQDPPAVGYDLECRDGVSVLYFRADNKEED